MRKLSTCTFSDVPQRSTKFTVGGRVLQFCTSGDEKELFENI